MTQKQSQLERCCLNCRYSHKESYGLLCWGEKEAPPVHPDDVCEYWKPIEDENGWRDIEIAGLPPADETIIVRDAYGRMFFAKYKNSRSDGEYWLVLDPAGGRHAIRLNQITHWMKKPPQPVVAVPDDLEFESIAPDN